MCLFCHATPAVYPSAEPVQWLKLSGARPPSPGRDGVGRDGASMGGMPQCRTRLLHSATAALGRGDRGVERPEADG